jgi:hypothetical protein
VKPVGADGIGPAVAALLGAGLLALLLPATPAAAQDSEADLLFNCRMAGVKRVYLVDMSRRTLIDQGSTYPATVSDDAIDAERLQDWGPQSRMRHRVHIGRRDGALVYEVDELDASGTALSRVVSETGICSAEKIHPRHFK